MNRAPHLAILFTSLLVACDELPISKSPPPSSDKEKFEMKEDKQGRTIRLNKVTGEMSVLEGAALVPVQSPEDAQRNAQAIAALAQKKQWPSTELPAISKDTTVYLSTSWREGKVYYQFWVTPSAKMKAAIGSEPYGNFQVLLADAGGFTLIKIPILFNRLTRIVDDEGKVTYYEANDSVPASQDLYRNATTYSLVWHF